MRSGCAVGFKTSLVVCAWWIAAGLVVACDDEDELPPPATRPMQSAATDELVPGTCLPDPASWERVDALLERSCNSCHAESVTGEARLGAPLGIDFDDEAAVARHADRIMVRAVVEGTMPPGVPLTPCSRAMLGEYLEGVLAGECMRDCQGRACGGDACGGTCGTCSDDGACNSLGVCVDAICSPNCGSRSCGNDGCGGSCGNCAAGTSCGDAGSCECVPSCEGRVCGSNGCGGACGECADNEACSVNGSCTCVPDCQDRQCGDDGCGGSCGQCAAPDECGDDGSCVCTPKCDGRVCGPDGCGSVCGACDAAGEAPLCNTDLGQCQATCTPSCTGKVCGDDGCGGAADACGSCAAGETCMSGTSCECVPSCTGKQCGPDGCGSECGSCADPLTCSDQGKCECVPNCADRECGDDGCDGSCGSCAAAGSYCDVGGVCQCTPSCTPGTCGDNGCGATCACEQGQICTAEVCGWPEVSFAADVYPLFVDTCNGGGCHTSADGAIPARGLDLLDAATAYGELVGVASAQCMSTATPKALVEPDDVGESHLINKLTGVGMCGGRVMPRSAGTGLPDPPPLSQAQIDIVRAWIETGALND
jgi:hypothetical protein